MNRALTYLAAAALAAPLTASANQDFSAVNRDVSVMAQILTGAFKSDHRHESRASVSGAYLAGQGAVFIVKSHPGLRIYSFHTSDDGSDNSNVFYLDSGDVDGSVPMPPVPPSVADIDPSDLGDLGSSMAMDILNGSGYAYVNTSHMDHEIRAAMRDVARELRDIDQQISDNRIELIHTDADSERKKLESKIADLQKKRDQVDGKREKLQKQIEAAQKKFVAKRKAMMQKAQELREKQLAETEQVVMESLCNYGSTLRHVPNNEHVSVIIEGRSGSGDNHHVYVMNKKDVTQCKSGDAAGLTKGAVTYSY